MTLRVRRIVPSLLLAAGLLMASGSLGSACAAFDDARLPPAEGGTNATNEGGTSSSGGPEAGCPVIRVPADPPTGTNESVKKEFVVTAHQLSLGLSDPPFVLNRKFGYDLDNACSCTPDPESCAAPADAGTTSKREKGCDLDNGIDNATGLLLLGIPIQQNPASYANEAIDTGHKGVLLRITGYNGEANDARVDITVYRSTGTEDGAGNPRTPVFTDPLDPWTVDDSDIKKGGADPYDGVTVGTGYVRDNVLVAKLKSSSFPFNTDADILLTEVQLTANIISKGGDDFALENGMAVGRWPVADVLSTVGKVQDPTNSQKRLCQTAAVFDEVRKLVCASVDLFDDPTFDNQGKPCNALSTAVGFLGSPAKLGKIVVPKRTNPCAGAVVGSCD